MSTFPVVGNELLLLKVKVRKVSRSVAQELRLGVACEGSDVVSSSSVLRRGKICINMPCF